jgi:hypothetical protein
MWRSRALVTMHAQRGHQRGWRQVPFSLAQSHSTHHQRRHRPWRGYPEAIGGSSPDSVGSVSFFWNFFWNFLSRERRVASTISTSDLGAPNGNGRPGQSVLARPRSGPGYPIELSLSSIRNQGVSLRTMVDVRTLRRRGQIEPLLAIRITPTDVGLLQIDIARLFKALSSIR